MVFVSEHLKWALEKIALFLDHIPESMQLSPPEGLLVLALSFVPCVLRFARKYLWYYVLYKIKSQTLCSFTLHNIVH